MYNAALTVSVVTGKDKGKVRPRTGYEDPDGA
jgi:hypothetical protein